jgi:hypothetical protein
MMITFSNATRGGREHIFFDYEGEKKKSKIKVSPKNFEKFLRVTANLRTIKSTAAQVGPVCSFSLHFSLTPFLLGWVRSEKEFIAVDVKNRPLSTWAPDSDVSLKAQKTLERQRRRKVGPKRRELKNKNKREGENVGENARLTCNVQVERWAGSLAFGVASVTCVASRRAARHSLQNQTRFADDHTGAHVVL